jgi:hypothetical protein
MWMVGTCVEESLSVSSWFLSPLGFLHIFTIPFSLNIVITRCQAAADFILDQHAG